MEAQNGDVICPNSSRSLVKDPGLKSTYPTYWSSVLCGVFLFHHSKPSLLKKISPTDILVPVFIDLACFPEYSSYSHACTKR